MSKSLAEMTGEIVENNTRLGWYENCATFPEAMALLHSEVSEALEAWRRWGLADMTGTSFPAEPTRRQALSDRPPKPEGVGSEFADIFIRLLDDAQLFGPVDLEKAPMNDFRQLIVSTSFPANMNMLHDLISKASREALYSMKLAVELLGWVLSFLRQLAEEYGIDLDAEYERKMAFNRTRAYRHGGKAI
jgi:hypothetical protein